MNEVELNGFVMRIGWGKVAQCYGALAGARVGCAMPWGSCGLQGVHCGAGAAARDGREWWGGWMSGMGYGRVDESCVRVDRVQAGACISRKHDLSSAPGTCRRLFFLPSLRQWRSLPRPSR
jgi:hypothetical protein